MPELITERVATNARQLKLLELAESADELAERAEQAKLGYREFLSLVLESEVGVRGPPLRLPPGALRAAPTTRHSMSSTARSSPSSTPSAWPI